jgi:uncharacterized BrkB/YihY/UPF0761 family membrane protein
MGERSWFGRNIEFAPERFIVKSHWMTLVTVIAAILFLALSHRVDLLLVVVPVSALIGGLAALEGVFGQRRI